MGVSNFCACLPVGELFVFPRRRRTVSTLKRETGSWNKKLGIVIIWSISVNLKGGAILPLNGRGAESLVMFAVVLETTEPLIYMTGEKNILKRT